MYAAWENSIRVENELRPVLLLLKFLGALPIEVPFTGRQPQFRVMSLSFVYCLVMYGIILWGMWQVHGHEFDSMQFDDSILAFYHLVLMLIVACLPFTFWRDSRALVRFLVTWNSAREVRGLLPSLKRRSCALTVVTVGLSVALELTYQLLYTAVDVVQFLTDVHVLALRLATVALWHVLCSGLSGTASRMLHSLSQELRSGTERRNKALAKHARKWLQLGQLVGLLGNAVHHTYSFFIVFMFAKMTLNIYWTLGSFLFNSNRHIVSVAYICISILIDLSLLFVFCDDAHRVHSKVAGEFQNLLLDLRVTDPNTSTEVDTFLLEIRCTQPELSLHGYLTVSRRLLVALMTTMVTYLVVLLQFKISNLSPGSSDTNTTTF